MLQNPNWFNPGRLHPVFHNYPAPGQSDKPYCIQNFVEGSTAAQLKAAGVTHVWDVVANGELDNTIGRCTNLSSAIFGSQTPSEATVRAAAENVTLYNNMIITDEFAEGDFPQVNATQTSEWFSDQINIKAAREGKTVTQHGEYGSQALNLYQNWKRVHNGSREPMSDYFLSLLQPNISSRLDNTLLRTYLLSNMKNIRGRSVSYYYSWEVGNIGDYLTTIPVQAMYQYNESNQDVLLFTWPKMQSNSHQIDVPQRDGGTRRPNGTIGYTFPHCPPEIMKIFSFFGSLFFDQKYLWGDWGIRPPDDDAYNGPYSSMDAFKIGNNWHISCVPALIQAGRNLICTDYTANGQRFSYTGTERLISRKGSPHFNNYYFNQTSNERKPFLITIPATNPVFIYLDPYSSPIESKAVTAHFDGRSFDLGTIPGMTLYVSL